MWEKISNLMNMEFDSEPVYGENDKYLKTKIKMYEDKVNTNRIQSPLINLIMSLIMSLIMRLIIN